MERYLHSIYCDDVRMEIGNKQSLIGVYGNDLIVPEFPYILPKLHIVVNLVTPTNNPFKNLTIKVTKDGEALINVPVSTDQLEKQQSNLIENEDKENGFWGISINLTLMISPFSIQKECTLRVLAETESEELKGRGLKIKMGGAILAAVEQAE